VPLMGHKRPTAHLRAVRDARAHSLGDHAHRQALQLRQNVAPKIDAVERSVIAPRNGGFPLLRGRSGAAALGFAGGRGILAGCAQARELGRAGRGDAQASRKLLPYRTIQ
jgi:hypothetical protein